MNHFPLPRRRLLARRSRWIVGWVIACALAVAVDGWMRQRLMPASYGTGYMMFAVLVVLAAYQWRKKFPMFSFPGAVSTWTQFHLYLGFFSVVLFGVHVGWRWPDGWLEGALATCYAMVVLSGLFGLYLSRTAPRRLRMLPRQVIYEQIPSLQRQLAAEARQTMMADRFSEVATRFYLNHLVPFLERTRPWHWSLRPTTRYRKLLVGRARDLDRYLTPGDRSITRTFVQWIEQKDDLDYHRAVQGQLKLWLVIHVGLTYGLLFLAAVHGMVATVFAGGGS